MPSSNAINSARFISAARFFPFAALALFIVLPAGIAQAVPGGSSTWSSDSSGHFPANEPAPSHPVPWVPYKGKKQRQKKPHFVRIKNDFETHMRQQQEMLSERRVTARNVLERLVDDFCASAVKCARGTQNPLMARHPKAAYAREPFDVNIRQIAHKALNLMDRSRANTRMKFDNVQDADKPAQLSARRFTEDGRQHAISIQPNRLFVLDPHEDGGEQTFEAVSYQLYLTSHLGALPTAGWRRMQREKSVVTWIDAKLPKGLLERKLTQDEKIERLLTYMPNDGSVVPLEHVEEAFERAVTDLHFMNMRRALESDGRPPILVGYATDGEGQRNVFVARHVDDGSTRIDMPLAIRRNADIDGELFRAVTDAYWQHRTAQDARRGETNMQRELFNADLMRVAPEEYQEALRLTKKVFDDDVGTGWSDESVHQIVANLAHRQRIRATISCAVTNWLIRYPERARDCQTEIVTAALPVVAAVNYSAMTQLKDAIRLLVQRTLKRTDISLRDLEAINAFDSR